MEVFPLAARQDSARYSVTTEDPAIRSKMEGGYVISRARFTRRPRKVFTTGFTDLSNDERVVLEAFWDQMQGGSTIFLWDNPVDGVQYEVRFVAPIEFSYAGLGGNHRWNVGALQLEEA